MKALIVGMGMVLASAGSWAQFGDPIDLPAGWACSGFDLRVEISPPGAHQQQSREFIDRSGNVVRVLAWEGKGNLLRFTNLNANPQTSITLKTGGSVSQERRHPDGSTSVMSTGHNAMIWFPGEIAAGPSTVLYIGNLRYTVSADGVFALGKVAGKTIDICALLSV